MNLRKFTRHVVDFTVYLFRNGFSDSTPFGSGRVSDLNDHGCKITSATPVSTGDHLAVRFYAPTLRPPVPVHSAVVRWTMGQEFGLEFLTMQQGDQNRLRQFIETLKPESQPS